MSLGGLIATANRARTRAGHEKGARNEELVVKALSRRSRPKWIARVVRSKPWSSLDFAGVDVTVYLNDGRRVGLQVKSSAKEAQRFRKKLRARGIEGAIGVVVVLDGDDLNTVYGKALGQVLVVLDPGLKGAA